MVTISYGSSFLYHLLSRACVGAGGLLGYIRTKINRCNDYVLLHKSEAVAWQAISFQIILFGEGNSDAIFQIYGSTRNGDNGIIKVKTILESQKIIKFYFKQDMDKSISIYIAARSVGFLKSTILSKVSYRDNENDELVNLDALDISTLTEVEPI